MGPYIGRFRSNNYEKFRFGDYDWFTIPYELEHAMGLTDEYMFPIEEPYHNAPLYYPRIIQIQEVLSGAALFN